MKGHNALTSIENFFTNYILPLIGQVLARDFQGQFAILSFPKIPKYRWALGILCYRPKLMPRQTRLFVVSLTILLLQFPFQQQYCRLEGLLQHHQCQLLQ